MYAIHIKLRTEEFGHSWPSAEAVADELAVGPGGPAEYVHAPRQPPPGHLGVIYLTGRSAAEAGERVRAAAQSLLAGPRADNRAGSAKLLVHAEGGAVGLCDATVLLSAHLPGCASGTFRPVQLGASGSPGLPPADMTNFLARDGDTDLEHRPD